MAVEAVSVAVVAARGARVGVARGILNVTQRHARVERARDHRGPQPVRTELADAGGAGEPADQPIDRLTSAADPCSPRPAVARYWRRAGPASGRARRSWGR